MSKRNCTKWLWFVLVIADVVSLLGGVRPASAQAAGPVIHYVSTTGANSGNCTVSAAPCRTINYAISQAAPGDRVRVAIGTYTGSGIQVVLIDKGIALTGGWNATFTIQSGRSTIDGQQARRGIMIETYYDSPVFIDRFVIQNGSITADGGGIYSNGAVLTLSNSALTKNRASAYSGGGIAGIGRLIVNSSTISGNTAGQLGWSGGGGGGGIKVDGTVTLNNTTISGNKIIGGFSGSALYVSGTAVLNKSTISGNTDSVAIYSVYGSMTLNNTTVSGNSGGGIHQDEGSISINNSTITRNTGDGGLSSSDSTGGTAILRNSILAGNTGTYGPDCNGTFISAGYNLIGNNSQCNFKANIGDKVGTGAAPLDPRLVPLANNGGPTLTHALLKNSPAVNAGNPAAPGSAGNACLAADQRGVARPVEAVCDMGAYEGHVAIVRSIIRASANPTDVANVNFTVTFTEPVIGVDTTDFALTTVGVTSASVKSLNGSGNTYTVTVGTGSGNGLIRLDLLDDDTILDASHNPLGGLGIHNANFKTGEVYTISKSAVPKAPAADVWDTTPTYQWTRVPQATQYRYQAMRGTTLLYDKIILPAACYPATCADTPALLLTPGSYQWRVQGMVGGVWQGFSPYTSFTLYAPKAGYWKGAGLEFYVTPSRVQVDNFAIYIDLTSVGCGKYKITYTPLVTISNTGTFAFTGSFHANGTFSKSTTSPASATGTLGLSNYLISDCGYISGGPFSWSAVWYSTAQPTSANIQGAEPGTAIPMLDAPFGFLPTGTFTVQP